MSPISYRVCLPLLLAGDLLLPFLLAPACPGYSHLTQVMSALGAPGAPLRWVYNGWLMIFGAALLACVPPLAGGVAQVSRPLAGLLSAVLAVYAAGGCLLAGIFPVGQGRALDTLSARVHGIGSAIGFLCLTFAPLLAGLFFLKSGRRGPGVLSLLCFGLAAAFFVLFVLGDKPRWQNTPAALAGLWQRLSLLCMYLPLAVLCW